VAAASSWRGNGSVHGTDLSALYLQINLDSFGGQLPADVPVSWSRLGGNDSGGIYLGGTGFDTGKPAIRISIEKIKTPEKLLHVMQHEMCHVATHDAVRKTGDDPHGLIWQDCMKRFQQP
jgi:hypothetical protein